MGVSGDTNYNAFGRKVFPYVAWYPSDPGAVPADLVDGERGWVEDGALRGELDVTVGKGPAGVVPVLPAPEQPRRASYSGRGLCASGRWSPRGARRPRVSSASRGDS